VVTLGTNTAVNGNGSTYVAYCFAEIPGFSKFSNFTGNGSADGPFIFTGFRPKYIMVKRTDAAQSWVIEDTSRNPYNVAALDLAADSAGAEINDTSVMDILSNGVKMRNSFTGFNASGGTYIYMAFAENPFANSNAR